MTRRVVWIGALIALAAAAASCETPGRILYKVGDKTVEVVQPSKAVAPATVTDSDNIAISTGEQQERDFAKEKRVGMITWAGIGVFLIGCASLIARAWFPVIPIGASIIAIAAGVALMWLPAIFDKSGPLLIGILVVTGIVYAVSSADNIVKLMKGPSSAET